MQMLLEIADGPRKGHTFELPDECVVLIGRSHRCHCRLGPDKQCSRVHLIMEVAAPGCRLRDLGSLNGTFVNGNRVEEAEVGDGDVILVGRTKLLVRVVEPPDLPIAEAAAPPEEIVSAPSQPQLGVEARPAEPPPEAAAIPRPPPAAGPARDEDTAPLVPCLRCGQASRPDGPSGPRGCPPGSARGPHASIGEGVEALAGQAHSALSYVCPGCQEEMRRAGETIPGYRLARQFRKGGMALLWLAEDTRNGRQVVVKTMIPDLAESQRAVRMFYRESKISVALRHPNIVEFLSAGQYAGQLYIVMEHVDGVDAEALRTERGGRLSSAEVVTIGRQVLAALGYAHGQGIVHRDVKPSNILVSGESPGCQVKVTDFGLARVYRAAGRSDITRRGDVRGSIPFMPPEQVTNCRGVDQRADIFALGATMYHLLTGRFCRDFNVKKKDPLLAVIEDEIVPIERRGVPVAPPLAEVVNRSLRREPGRRFRSAAEMSAALASAL